MHIRCIRMQDTWCIGLAPHIPGYTPANQCQESWHKHIKEVLKGKMRASMSVCLNTTLPLVFWDDGVNRPDTIHVGADIIPKKMVLKALRYVQNRTKMMKGKQEQLPAAADGAPSAAEVTTYTCHVLRFKAKFKTLTPSLIK